MKKLILSAFMLIGIACSAQDISKNALGLRLGSNDGLGGEISFQRKLSSENRLELDLGWRNRSDYYNKGYDDNTIKFTGLYQWVWEIDNCFNWYAGVGGGLGSWSTKNDTSGSFVYIAGDIGIEYNFDEVPIMLSLDFRPEFGFGGNKYYRNNYGSDIALGIRYRFD